MRVLITGATGLVGSKIVELCRDKGIEVHYLTTSKDKIENKPDYKGFYWNPDKDQIDPAAFNEVDTIIHLAGTSIAQRWTPDKKKEILNSRIQTAKLLFKNLQEDQGQVKQFISASAIGIYPSSLEKLYSEADNGVDDSFVGEVVVKWEEAADEFEDLGLKVSKVRIGLVLAEDGGMLEKLKEPVAFNVGAPLGSGNQWQSWIHIEDLARIFLHLLQNKLEGTYNAVAPNPVTNKELVREVASQMGKPVWLPPIPGFALKLALGEMAHLLLSSQLVSSNKIEKTGFVFKYVNLPKALDKLIA
ncbi:TIGR01777 family oxidoreductase [Salegentibacter sp. HM20]